MTGNERVSFRWTESRISFFSDVLNELENSQFKLFDFSFDFFVVIDNVQVVNDVETDRYFGCGYVF